MPGVATNNLTFQQPSAQLPSESAELGALAGHLRAGRCALFVGAGLSAPAGLPTWGELIDHVIAEATPWAVEPKLFPKQIDMEEPVDEALREPAVAAIRAALGRARFNTLCRRIGRATGTRMDLQVLNEMLDVVFHDSIERDELRKLAESKRYTELAGHCRDRLGHERFHDLVRQLLTPSADLPATHRDIVRSSFSCVVTTNFDMLLEDAYARYGGSGAPRAPTGAELGQHGTLLLDRGFFVLKAHGDALRPETMIFTADDYRRVIHSNPAFQAIMNGILLTHAVLFVGYSLNDVNFRLLLDNQLTIFNGNVPPRYAVLSGVGAAEREILWRTAKLQVLSYPEGQHAEVGRCLSVLANQSTGTRRVKPNVGSVELADQSVFESLSTLLIASNGDRLSLELVQRRTGARPHRVWIGGCAHPGTSRLGPQLRKADGAQSRGERPMRDIRSIGSALAAALPPSLRRALARTPSETIEIACSSAATRLPWEWTMIGGKPLSLRHAVVRRPVDITHEARGRRSVHRPLRALVFGDTGFGDSTGSMPLHYADLEAATIEQLFRSGLSGARVTRLSRQDATHRRVLEELSIGDYDVIHFGGHAWFDDRDAYFYLWDRIMLGSELAPLLSRRPPALLVLNTHYTAFVLAEADAKVRDVVGSPRQRKVTPPLGTARGFCDSAMRCGVACFMGAFGNVGDRTGAELSVAFYAELLTGRKAAEALRIARAKTARTALDAGMFYTVFGYPDFQLVAPREGGATARVIVATLARMKASWSEPKSLR